MLIGERADPQVRDEVCRAASCTPGIERVNGVLTVIPAALTVTADNGSKVYGQLYTPATSAFTSAGLVNGDVIGAVSEASTGDAATAGVAGAPVCYRH